MYRGLTDTEFFCGFAHGGTGSNYVLAKENGTFFGRSVKISTVGQNDQLRYNVIYGKRCRKYGLLLYFNNIICGFWRVLEHL